MITYYTEWSAGFMIATVDKQRKLRWWSDKLSHEDRQYARDNLPRWDINQQAWLR